MSIRPAPTRTAAWLMVCLLLASVTSAHEIPADARIELLIDFEAGTAAAPRRLHAFVRVPLESLRDVDFPLRANGALDIAAGRPLLKDTVELWLGDELRFLEGGVELPRPTLVDARFALPGEPRTRDLAGALALQRPLPDAMSIPWRQTHVVAHYRLDLPTTSRDIAIASGLHHLGLRTRTQLTVRGADPARPTVTRTLLWQGAAGPVPLAPGFLDVVTRFLGLGAAHIVFAADHLLFLACLVLPPVAFGRLLGVVTAFTLAHAVTLGATALGWIVVGDGLGRIVEWLVAASILLVALQRLLLPPSIPLWPVAYGFGLIHGFAFAGFLASELQWAGDGIATALLGFNLGIELGQIAALFAMVGLWAVVRWLGGPAATLRVVLFALVAHAAWHWSGERWTTLPADPLGAAGSMAPNDTASTLALALVVALAVFGGLLAGALATWLHGSAAANENPAAGR